MRAATRRRLGGLAALVACGIAAVVLYRYWTRPPAVEIDNLRYIQLLWTAVSSRDADKLDRVEAALRRRRESEEMSDRELEHFLQVVAVARTGAWERADRLCFGFAEAQLSRSRHQHK